jgi:uncharacterized protein (TIGR03435 family)
MISEYLSTIWAALAPSVANHLWQSTLCLVMAGLLTLILRKNHARARYALWLAASIKFLIPFSLLIAVGIHLARPRPAAPAESGFYFAVEEVSQPFTLRANLDLDAGKSRPAPSGRYKIVPVVPAVLVALWVGGLLGVLAAWWVRWRRVFETLRAATPLREGREVETLRRLERLAGVRKPIDVVLSNTSLEPGVFGIFRPVLVWPAGISEHLEDAHLEGVIAHEVWHVCRHDNLAAAIHMLVEALFWFHPLVWWLGARLVEERERACDEEVLMFGSQPKNYAESILKTCEFCVESPLACVSGVTGADLKKRIARIMTEHLAHKVSLGKKLLLAAVAITAFAGPVVFGLLNAPQIQAQSAQTASAPTPSFEVATVKPNKPDASGQLRVGIGFEPGRFVAMAVTLKQLIALAYNVRDMQVSGGPSWVDSERFDVNAKEEDADAAALEKLPPEQRSEQLRLRVQSLLADRFKLTLRHETKDFPIYALVVAKNGPKLQESKPGGTAIKGPDGRPAGGQQMMRMGPGELNAQGIPMESLARLLSQQLGRTVVDKTGLKGNYDFTLQWAPEQGRAAMIQGPPPGPGTVAAPPPESSGPSIFTAIQEQLGLKLESQKGPVENLVIDHVEKPSAN